jgi:hypothetical protein
VGEKRSAYWILVGKSEGKRPLRRTRHRWLDHIKMCLKEIRLEGIDWVDQTQDREK